MWIHLNTRRQNIRMKRDVKLSYYIIIIIIMYLIHKFQQTMEYIRIYLQICTNNKKRNGNLKDISYYNVSKKEIDLAENGIPMIFPGNEYYRFCRFRWCYQRFVFYYS